MTTGCEYTDKIYARFQKGLCPICKKELDGFVRAVEYKGDTVMICKHHKTRELTDV